MMTFLAYLDWLVTNANGVSGRRPVQQSPPKHPGIVLRDEFLLPSGLTQTALATRTGATQAKINEIVNGKRGITATFALALEHELEAPAAMWLSLQAEYDLWQARQAKKLRKTASAD